MKILFILCALTFVLGLMLTNSTFGQTYSGHPNFPEAYIQVVHRNANGDLMGYYESTLAYFTNVFLLNEILDTHDPKIIEKDGQTLEVFIIQRQSRFSENYKGQMSSYDLTYKEFRPLQVRQDGYFGEPGDTVTAIFTIVRIVQ